MNQGEVNSFPLESNEVAGCFVGFSESVGNKMNYKILNEMTGKILFRSCIKHTELVPNRRVFDNDAGETNESNDDVSNADEEQATNTDNSDRGNTIPEILQPIDAHQGHLKTTDPAYRGSRWNVRVTWENFEVTYEPLSVAKCHPVYCALYSK